jgi:hypothetical protein
MMIVSGALLSTAQGASVNFAGYQFWTNGDAGLSGTDLELTPNAGSQAGTAFISVPYDLTGNPSFNVFFQFRIPGGTGGADGITFMIQNDPDKYTALGAEGGSIGYETISNSLAVEFDTYQNGNYSDPDDNHVGIDTNGNMISLVTADPGFDINDGNSYYVWMDYDGTTNTLAVFVSTTNSKPATALITYTVDINSLIGNKAYIGFSAGTGAAANQHLIEDFSISGLDAYNVAVPALDEWGVVLLALMLGSISLIWIRKWRTE